MSTSWGATARGPLPFSEALLSAVLCCRELEEFGQQRGWSDGGSKQRKEAPAHPGPNPQPLPLGASCQTPGIMRMLLARKGRRPMGHGSPASQCQCG